MKNLDRINPDGNYVVENCRFIELTENSGRARRTKKAKMAGKRSLENLKKKKDWTSYLWKPVIQKTLGGEIIGSYKSMVEAERINNLPLNSVSRVCNGHNKQAGGFKWEKSTECQEQS